MCLLPDIPEHPHTGAAWIFSSKLPGNSSLVMENFFKCPSCLLIHSNGGCPLYYSISKPEHWVSPVSAVSLCDYDHSVTLRSHISTEVLTICNFVCNTAAAFTFHNGPNILHFMPKFFFRENILLFEEKIHDRKRNGKESILNSQCVSEFMN